MAMSRFILIINFLAICCVISQVSAQQPFESSLGFKFQPGKHYKIVETDKNSLTLIYVGEKPFQFQPVTRVAGRRIESATTQTEMVPLFMKKMGYSREQVGQFKNDQGLVFETFTSQKVTDRGVKYTERFYFLYNQERALNLNIHASLPAGAGDSDFAKYVEPAVHALSLTPLKKPSLTPLKK